MTIRSPASDHMPGLAPEAHGKGPRQPGYGRSRSAGRGARWPKSLAEDEAASANPSVTELHDHQAGVADRTERGTVGAQHGRGAF